MSILDISLPPSDCRSVLFLSGSSCATAAGASATTASVMALSHPVLLIVDVWPQDQCNQCKG